MSEATGQFQVANQPVSIRQLGLPGVPMLRLIPVASATGNAMEVRNTSGVVVSAFGVDGTFTTKMPNISVTANKTLTAQQSGSLINFNVASGAIVTLPAPAVGLFYWFNCLQSVTSNNYEIDTDAGTTFLMGGVRIASSTTAGDFFANGTSHVKMQLNGSTKGGLIGSAFGLACVSATQWTVLPGALISGSGTAATPFA